MKKIFSVFLTLCMILSLTGCGSGAEENADNKGMIDNSHMSANGSEDEYSLDELLSEMGIGWNLGNTLDSPEGETAWGQPVTTKEMIDKIHELGFNTLRIPTSWGLHTSGEPDYVIDADWITRVEEIVNYALSNDMFVILNSHHDNDFYYPSREHEEESINYIEKIWTQIAERFKDYDQHLIFQSMNEPRLTGTNYEWWVDYNNQDCLDAIDIINKMNQKFVDVVRASGSENENRYLLCSSYCGSPDYSLEDPYKLPDDTAKEKLLISVHGYTPYNLTMNDDSQYRTFGDAEKRELDNFMEKHYNKYGKNGVGVIIDEMGIINKNNPYDRQDWAAYYVAKAKSLGEVCIWWDNGNVNPGSESYGLFDRNALEIFETSEAPYKGLMEGLSTPLDEIVSSKPQDE